MAHEPTRRESRHVLNLRRTHLSIILLEGIVGIEPLRVLVHTSAIGLGGRFTEVAGIGRWCTMVVFWRWHTSIGAVGLLL